MATNCSTHRMTGAMVTLMYAETLYLRGALPDDPLPPDANPDRVLDRANEQFHELGIEISVLRDEYNNNYYDQIREFSDHAENRAAALRVGELAERVLNEIGRLCPEPHSEELKEELTISS